MKDLATQVVARRAAFDEVAGQRERRAGEADDRLLARQLAADDPHRVEREPQLFIRLERAQAGHVRGRPDRVVDDRADVRLDLEVDAHRLERQHDVGEQHRGIDAQQLDGHQGDLGAQLRGLGDLEDAVALAHAPVGLERPAGLAHEPDGRRVDRLAAARGEHPPLAGPDRCGPGARSGLTPRCRSRQGPRGRVDDVRDVRIGVGE